MKTWKSGKFGKFGMGLAVAMLALSTAGTVLAQGPGDGGPHRPPMDRGMGPGGPGGRGGPRGDMGRWWNDPRVVEKLKLSDAQRKSMDDIYQKHRLTLVDLHASLEKAELEMEPLMRADQPEEGKILSQIDRIAQSRAELEKANARMLLGMRKQLTPEQWKQMEAERAARREGRDGRDDGHGPMQDRMREHRKWKGPSGSGGPGMTPGPKGTDAPPAPGANGPGAGGPNGLGGPMAPDAGEPAGPGEPGPAEHE